MHVVKLLDRNNPKNLDLFLNCFRKVKPQTYKQISMVAKEGMWKSASETGVNCHSNVSTQLEYLLVIILTMA